MIINGSEDLAKDLMLPMPTKLGPLSWLKEALVKLAKDALNDEVKKGIHDPTAPSGNE